MTTSAPTGHPPAELPAAAWWLGWSFLGGQLVNVVLSGFQDASAWPLSILLGVALVAFFSHGVLRARMVRTVLIGVLLGIAALAEAVAVLLGHGQELLGLAVTGVQIACFVAYVRTPWFAWQRERPAGGPSIAPLMAIAVVVGVLAGLIGADTGAGVGTDLRVGR